MPKKQCNKCGLYQDNLFAYQGKSYCNGCKLLINNNKNNRQQGYNPYLDEGENSSSKGIEKG